ncbi:hypothetical protein LTS10_004521 [Elasticomyces elasticus]|nr:hypothetical protein LTS10_004521 [Elasticomyces elasticus]
MATRHRDSSNAPEVYEMHSDLETVLVNAPARRALELPPRESNFRNDAQRRSSFFREWQQFRLSKRKRRPFASRLFWVIFGATVVVLTVAVGGGVGGSLAMERRAHLDIVNHQQLLDPSTNPGVHHILQQQGRDFNYPRIRQANDGNHNIWQPRRKHQPHHIAE